MADIRQSTVVLDDFNRPAQNPIGAPWQRTSSIWTPARLASGSPIDGGGYLKSTGNPPTGSASSWGTEAWDGDDAEVWATAIGNPPLTEGFRIGLMRDLYPASTDGYMCLPHNNVGTDSWVLRRYTNNSYFNFGGQVVPLPFQGEIVLMRRNGNFVEVWRDFVTNGANWTMVWQVTDVSYTLGLYATLGGTGGNVGWDRFGGGPFIETRRTQMYRWLATRERNP